MRGKQVNTITVKYTNTYIHTRARNLPEKRLHQELKGLDDDVKMEKLTSKHVVVTYVEM